MQRTTPFIILLLFSAVLLSSADACNKIKTFGLNEEFTLAVSQLATCRCEGGEELILAFTGVEEDSRCPEGVNCIQAGKVVVTLRANSLTGPAYRLTLDGADRAGNTAKIDGYTVELLKVDPYPANNRTIVADDYQATLRVTR